MSMLSHVHYKLSRLKSTEAGESDACRGKGIARKGDFLSELAKVSSRVGSEIDQLNRF